MADPRFVLAKASNGQFKWVLKAGNGEVIAVSETYTTKASAINGIESVQKNAPIAEIVDITS
jgi:uncharacterized protein YegP (UPF0339 family)